MISYFKFFFISAFLCISLNSNVIAYPSSSSDIRSVIDQKVNTIIYDLNLENGRDINLNAAGIFGCVTFFLAIANDGRIVGYALPFASLAACIFNINRALQKTRALNDLEDIKRIVRNHVEHLHGYVR